MKTDVISVKKLALLIIFSALGIAISPVSWFVFLGTKAFPGQHLINAILGVLLGPIWAAIGAILVGSTRNLLNIGSIYAFPGGIPGGIAVGIVYGLLKRLKVNKRRRFLSALSEPIGTLLIGVPLSLFLVAPWMETQSLLDLRAQNGALIAFFILGAGWALSCIPGSILGFILLIVLDKANINRDNLFGEK